MTALAAYWSFGSDEAASACSAMLMAQAIYGKESSSHAIGSIALGRRLWPLTPEDRFDNGPLAVDDQTLVLCADVRLDNRDELAAMLSLSGSIAHLSDAELFFIAYQKWGNDAFIKLYGAFAVIIWDAKREKITLARDPFGERPLHYHIAGGFVAVASMAKGLHCLHGVPYAVRPDAMADFLALVPETGSETFFKGIERALPGHITTIDKEGCVVSKAYWRPPDDMLYLENNAQYEDALRATFTEAVRARLRRTSGPIASHLSAGLDSSSVTATAARLLGTEPLIAFTSVPVVDVLPVDGVMVDEGPLARATAQLYPNIDHIEIMTGGQSPLDGLDNHFHIYERPVMNICNAVWDAAINASAKARGVTVMLTGAMGNMTISHTGIQQLNHLLGRCRFPSLIRLMRQMHSRGHGWKGLIAQLVGPFTPVWVWAWVTRKYGQSQELHLYSAIKPAALHDFTVTKRAALRRLDLAYRPWADSRAMRIWVMTRVDVGVYNKGALAGWGIDLRDPTLDRRLVELTLRIPDAQFILNGERRSLIRRAFSDRLPRAVISEYKSGRQAADWYLGMSAAHSAIGSELEAFERNQHADALIDIQRLKKAHADWRNVNPAKKDSNFLYRLAMYRAVAAGHFLRKVDRTN
jgi:asparagine synthase (glutamine-hydrolysing)